MGNGVIAGEKTEAVRSKADPARVNTNHGGERKMNPKSLFGSPLMQFRRSSKSDKMPYTASIRFRHPFGLVALLALFFLLWAGQCMAQGNGQARTVARQVLPSVVTILMYDSQGRQIGSGSGFILSKQGLIATCYHVIEKADSAKVRLQSGDVFNVVGYMEFDIEKDFAIIKINAVELVAVKLGNSDRLEIAENMIAMGAPLGLPGTVTTGIVSQIRTQGGHRVIQHTAPISPGSSGGPLVNESGQVVGVNSFLLQGGQSIYFALPINYVRAAWENSSGKITSLSRLREASQVYSEKIIGEVIKKLFDLYRDPDGLFSMFIRRDWQMKRSEKAYGDGDDPDYGAHREVIFMNYPGKGETISRSGVFREGLRLSLRVPPEGKVWKIDWAKRWQSEQIEDLLNAYSQPESTEVKAVKIGNAPVYAIVVSNKSGSKRGSPGLTILYVGIDPKCLMVLELAMPAEKTDELELINTSLSLSFNAGWIRKKP
jgi:S1-C subfamily serine protease